jgi:alpha-beta hydrolase superfamily lysophospholipase
MCEQVARTFAADLLSGRFESCLAAFDAAMLKALPEPKLRKVADELEKSYGRIKLPAEGSEAEPPPVAVSRLRGVWRFEFDVSAEKTPFAVRVVVTDAGKVTGLFHGPNHGPKPEPQPSDNPPAYTVERVTVDAFPDSTEEKYPLPGELWIPSLAGESAGAVSAIVVFVHGSGPGDRDGTVGPNKPYRDMAAALAARGIGSLRYDKRTRWYGREMGKETPLFTVKEETVEDAAAAIRMAAARKNADGTSPRVFVAGHSLGGYVAPRIAVAAPELTGIILLAGNTRPLEKLIPEQLNYIAMLDGSAGLLDVVNIEVGKWFVKQAKKKNLKPTDGVWLGANRIPGSYILDLRGYSPADSAAKLMLPMLILQGERDYQVTMDDFAGWKAKLKDRPNVTFRSFPTLNHLFLSGEGPANPEEYGKPGRVPDEVSEVIAEWITGVLKTP